MANPDAASSSSDSACHPSEDRFDSTSSTRSAAPATQSPGDPRAYRKTVSQGTEKKRKSRAGEVHRRSLPTPGPSPFQPFSGTSFSVPLATVIKSQGAEKTSPFEPFAKAPFSTPLEDLIQRMTVHSSFSSAGTGNRESAPAHAGKASKHAKNHAATGQPAQRQKTVKEPKRGGFLRLFACW